MVQEAGQVVRADCGHWPYGEAGHCAYMTCSNYANKCPKHSISPTGDTCSIEKGTSVNTDMRSMPDHYPHRGDQVEAWIKDRRDHEPEGMPGWHALDNLLDEYRLAADTGQSLEEVVNGDIEEVQPVRKKKEKR